MSEKKQDWYFTFGQSHKHHDGYIKIHGTQEGAREEMFRRWGSKWFTNYSWGEFEHQIAEFGLYEVKEGGETDAHVEESGSDKS